MESNLHLLDTEAAEKGIAVPAIASVIFHALLLLIAWVKYSRVEVPAPKPTSMSVVQLVPRVPSIGSYFEAPGEALAQPPSRSAPLSNANRRANAPQATGPQVSSLPGTGGLFSGGGIGGARPSQSAQAQATPPPLQPSGIASSTIAAMASTLPIPPPRETTRGTAERAAKGSADGVDWQSAIREVGKVTSPGDGQNVGVSGGEPGFADAGPISFESQWFEWGDYADSMVRKIRVNWYDNMPPLIRMGVKGIVTIRFTIQRGGRITDITVLESSGVPPFDFAAKKAIELSSPLAPLPENFPNPQERVTAQFYYNVTPPTRARR